MNKKIIWIFIFMLLAITVIPVTGNIREISNNNLSNNITNPLVDDKWMKTFGGIKDEHSYCVIQTSDGGYMVLGSTDSSGPNGRDIWLIKTDNQGSMIWDKKYGGKSYEYGWSIKQTNDGGYIITGETSSYGNGNYDVWLVKIDSEGNQLWNKTFGYSLSDSGSEVEQTSDNGYIIIGSVHQTGGSNGYIWLIKTDSDGNKIWDKIFGGSGHHYGNNILLTSDGGYILSCASFNPEETDGYNTWLIKTDKTGEILWDKKYGGAGFDVGWSIHATNDGGYIITGETSSYGDEQGDTWLLKILSNGEELWNKTFKDINTGRGMSVIQTNDNGYLIAGHTTRGFKAEAMLIKTNIDGKLEWKKTYGKLFGNEMFFSVKQTTDNGYIITGDITSYGTWLTDIWLLKMDSEGNVPNIKASYDFNWLSYLERFPIFKEVISQLI